MEIIKNKLKILSNHKYQIFLWGLVFFTVVFLFVLPLLVNAQTPPDPTATNALNEGESRFKQLIYGVVVGVFGRILLFGAGILSFAVNYFVIGAGEVFTNWGVGYAVDQTWSTVRDFFNLTFIFGLVYIGFKMILGSDDSRAQKTLLSLIGAALLVNFSLFITKFVVDVANSAAAMMAMALKDSSGTAITSNLGTGLVNLLHLSSALNIGAAEAGDAAEVMSESAVKAVVIAFITVILFSIAAFTFAVGGILLIVRFIVLAFYMIFSPLMFLGWVFPDFNNYSRKYWSGFLSQAFMAPAYIFCLYFSIIVLQNFEYHLPSGGLDLSFVVAKLGDNSMLAAFYYVFAIILFLGSASVAKKMAKDGGGAVMDTTLRVVNRAEKIGSNTLKVVTVGAAAGAAGASVRGVSSGAGFAGRRVIGGTADKLRNNTNLQKATTQSGLGGFAARRLMGASETLSDASFDVRNVKVGKKTLGERTGSGKGAKKGYATRMKDREKAVQKRAEERYGNLELDETDPLVKRRLDEQAALEKRVEDKKIDLDAEKDKDRKKVLNDEYRELKKKYEEAKKKTNLEKQRLVVGSTFDKDIVDAQADLEKLNRELAEAQKQSDQRLVTDLQSKIADREILIRDTEDFLKQNSAVDRGSYVGTLATSHSGWDKVSNFFSGSTRRIEAAAAAELVKKYTKTASASKQDAATQAIVESIKSSASTTSS